LWCGVSVVVFWIGDFSVVCTELGARRSQGSERRVGEVRVGRGRERAEWCLGRLTCRHSTP
jgi:hypothetical protein